MYLENEVIELSKPNAEIDLYELAIIGYALSLAGSDKIPQVVALLDKKATKKGKYIFKSFPVYNNFVENEFFPTILVFPFTW